MMKRIRELVMLSLWAVIVLSIFIPNPSQALSEREIRERTHIINLEATPIWFRPGQPIDFVVTIRYDGGTQDGFDVGVFHEGRLVGWEMNKRFNHGLNTFRLHDRGFRGDPGSYIIKLRFRGRVFTERRFAARSHCMFTLDPRATPPGP